MSKYPTQLHTVYVSFPFTKRTIIDRSYYFSNESDAKTFCDYANERGNEASQYVIDTHVIHNVETAKKDFELNKAINEI